MRTLLLSVAVGALAGACSDDPEVYFSHSGGCLDRIVGLSNQAESSLWAAVYSFTHVDAADALVATARRGIEVYVVVEKQQQDLAVLRTLTEGGVDVRVDGNGSAMHHKFVVVDGVILATGSFNWTQNAEHRNDENLVVLYDEDVAAAFAGEFQRVWDEGVEP